MAISEAWKVAVAASLALSWVGLEAQTKDEVSADTISALSAFKSSTELVLDTPETAEWKIDGLLWGLEDRINAKLPKGIQVAAKSTWTMTDANVDWYYARSELWNFQFDTEAELALFEEYSKKLWGEAAYLAFELVKGKKEFIDNYMKSSDKEEDESLADVEERWDDIFNEFFIIDNVTDDMEFLVKHAPNLSQYVREHWKYFWKNNVSRDLWYLIWANELDKRAAENNERAAENNRIAAEKNKIAAEKNKIAENFRKINAKFGK